MGLFHSQGGCLLFCCSRLISAHWVIAGPRVGAFTYNVLHHRGIAVVLYFLGIYLEQPMVIWAGLIIFLHSTLDRALGFGLKYPDSFQNTHLGAIGRAASKS